MAATAALRAFREEFISTGVNPDDFADFESRKVRYAIMWAQYGNDIYREVHSWARTYKTRFGLYKYIRNIYNPAYRIGEFHKAHIWGGRLDVEAGTQGCLPIETDNSAIRPHIAQVWQWSSWDRNKDIVALRGCIEGDVIINVIDAIDRVYLRRVDPSTVSELVKDEFGHIKGYTIEESRVHPVNNSTIVTYKEVCRRNGQAVVFSTFLNDAPFAWPDNLDRSGRARQEWSEAYGFVPMVHIQHNDVGLEWGWSELFPARSKVHEIDDLASVLSDQIRKNVNVKWLFAGLKKTDLTREATTTTTARPEPGREEQDALFATDPNAQPHALVAQLDLPGAIQHISEILKELERDYPELKFDAMRVSGEISGKSLRVARQPVETKIAQRRANYDSALVDAQQMALSIGGMRGLFPGISLDSYDRGALSHTIGEREIFATDSLDTSEEEKAFWDAAQSAIKAGIKLEAYLERAGWSKEDIRKAVAPPEPPPVIVNQPPIPPGVAQQ